MLANHSGELTERQLLERNTCVAVASLGETRLRRARLRIQVMPRHELVSRCGIATSLLTNVMLNIIAETV